MINTFAQTSLSSNRTIMRVLFTNIFLFFVTLNLLSQTNHYHEYHYHKPSNFKLDDQYYQKSLRGLGNLMEDLRLNDIDLYKELNPAFSSLQNRQITANAILAGGTVLGSVVAWSSIRRQSPQEYGGVIAGLSIVSLAGLIYAFTSVKPDEISKFVNFFNRTSNKCKIEITIQFNGGESSSEGLGLVINF